MVAEVQNNKIARISHVLNNRRADIAAVLLLLCMALFLGVYGSQAAYEAHVNPPGTMLPEDNPYASTAAGASLYISGINYESFRYLCPLFFGLTALLIYILFSIGMRRSTAFTVTLLLLALAGFAALRNIQRQQVDILLEFYSNAPVEPVETTCETSNYRTLIKPVVPMAGRQGSLHYTSLNAFGWETAVEYLMLEFYPHEKPIPITLRYQPELGSLYIHRFVVPSDTCEKDAARFYLPVYVKADWTPEEFFSLRFSFRDVFLDDLLVPYRGTKKFPGLEFFEEDVPLLKGVYRVTDMAKMNRLFYLHIPGDKTRLWYCMYTTLEKELAALPVMLRYWANGDAEATVLDWLELLDRFQGYERFADRAMTLIPKIGDLEKRCEAWHTLAKSTPERAETIAVAIAGVGDRYKENGAYEQAEAKYRLALMLSPSDMGHQVKLADALFMQDRVAEALKNYRAVLMATPESPYPAMMFDSVCRKQNLMEEATRFWQTLHEKYPDAAVPALHLGKGMERQDRLDEALELYKQVEALHPDNAEAILREGIVLALKEGYAKGRGLMDRALELAPQLRPELVAGLTRIATHYTKTGAHAFAEAIYREVIEIASDDVWRQTYFGEPSARVEREDAVKALQELLQSYPDHAEAQAVLDKLQTAEQPGKE